MMETVKSTSESVRAQKNSSLPLSSSVSFSISFLASVLIVSWFSYQTVKKEVKTLLLGQLSMSLPRSVKMFKIWESNMKANAEALASDPDIQKHSLGIKKNA